MRNAMAGCFSRVCYVKAKYQPRSSVIIFKTQHNTINPLRPGKGGTGPLQLPSIPLCPRRCSLTLPKSIRCVERRMLDLCTTCSLASVFSAVPENFACLVMLESFFLNVWPIHLHLLVLIVLSIGSWVVRRYSMFFFWASYFKDVSQALGD